MAVLEIIKFPDKRLREKAELIKKISSEIKKIAMDMLETMYNAKGVGLAATQVGIPVRLIIIDIDQLEGEPKPCVYINPELVLCEGSQKSDEGCLSVPGYTAPVERFLKVRVRYQTIDGRQEEIETEGFLAKALQHEIDHLNGIVFIDRLSKLRRELFLKKLKKSMEKTL